MKKNTGRLKQIYKEEDHIVHLKDTLNASRIIEARSLEEANQIYREQLEREYYFENHSSSAHVKIEDVKFIDDPIEEGTIKVSDPKNMALLQFTHLDCNRRKRNIYLLKILLLLIILLVFMVRN